MNVLESIRGVTWARRRQPDQVVYAAALAHERFRPDELLKQAVEAERAGFDAIVCSDHLAPWWAPGEPAPASRRSCIATTRSSLRSRSRRSRCCVRGARSWVSAPAKR